MSKPYRITGLPRGDVDSEKHEIHFTLGSAEKDFSFIAKYGVASQVIGALGRMFFELKKIMATQKGMETTAAEELAAFHIQKERWNDLVLVELITSQGVPYTFAIPNEIAADIADRLKTESGKSTQVGSA